MKNKIKILIVCIMICCGVGRGLLASGDVYSEGYAGEGASTTGTATDCGGFTNGYQGLCCCNSGGYCANGSTTCYLQNGDTDGTGCGYFGGGKSWRIFSLESSGYVPNSTILDKYISVDTVRAACREVGATHYVAFGWDRPYNRTVESAWGGHYYAGRLTGPAKRAGAITGARYNFAFLNGKAYTWSDIENMTVSDMDRAGASQAYGLKIVEAAATRLYHRYQDGIGAEHSSIPNDVGYFCYGDGMNELAEQFEGRVAVGDEVVGWTQEAETKTIVVEDCDAVEGCAVTFSHALRRKSGEGSTNYDIVRESNYGGVSSETLVGETVEDFASGNEREVKTDTVVLKPGVVVCETLTFDASVKAENVPLSLCASATGKAQPEGGDGTLIDMEVRNQDSAKYAEFTREEIYAKPGDTVEFRATYNPVLQYTYNLVPQRMRKIPVVLWARCLICTMGVGKIGKMGLV